MKFTASGVTLSAAITRSSALSVTMTIRPLAMSLTTSSIASNWNFSFALLIIPDLKVTVPQHDQQLRDNLLFLSILLLLSAPTANGASGTSDIEGKAARARGEGAGTRPSFN